MPDLLGDRLGYALDLGNLLGAGRTELLHRAEVAHDGLLALGTHALDLVEHRHRHRLVAQLAMEGDGEAVALVTNLLDEVEGGRAAGQDHRRVVPGNEHLLVRLGQAADRDVETQGLELVHRGRELGFAAVHHEQVGTRAKALVGHALRRVAAAQHFLHAEEVVGLLELGTHLEATILPLVGTTIGENHHRGHGEAAMQGRDVEALDAKRRPIEGKGAFQLEKCLVGAVVRIARANHVAHEGMAGVFLRHLKQGALLATLRTMQTAHAAALVGKPLAQDVGVGQLLCQVDLGRNVGRLVEVALDEALRELFLAHVEALVEHELVGTHHAPLAHAEDASAADGLLAIEAHRVETGTL